MRIITEKLNYLDHMGIDNDNYYDLLNLYESVQQRLSAQDKLELKKLLNTTDDPKTISAYLDSKNEDFQDDITDDDLYYDGEEYEYDEKYQSLCDDILGYITDNRIYVDDIFPTTRGIVITISGDWKHEHLRLNSLLKKYFVENEIVAKIDTIPITNDGSDQYTGNHVITILYNGGLQTNNKLKESLNEELSNGLDELNRLAELSSQYVSQINRAIITLKDEGKYDAASTLEVDVLMNFQETVSPWVAAAIDEYNEHEEEDEYDE